MRNLNHKQQQMTLRLVELIAAAARADATVLDVSTSPEAWVDVTSKAGLFRITVTPIITTRA